jgi:hypothetical protein
MRNEVPETGLAATSAVSESNLPQSRLGGRSFLYRNNTVWGLGTFSRAERSNVVELGNAMGVA